MLRVKKLKFKVELRSLNAADDFIKLYGKYADHRDELVEYLLDKKINLILDIQELRKMLSVLDSQHQQQVITKVLADEFIWSKLMYNNRSFMTLLEIIPTQREQLIKRILQDKAMFMRLFNMNTSIVDLLKAMLNIEDRMRCFEDYIFTNIRKFIQSKEHLAELYKLCGDDSKRRFSDLIQDSFPEFATSLGYVGKMLALTTDSAVNIQIFEYFLIKQIKNIDSFSSIYKLVNNRPELFNTLKNYIKNPDARDDFIKNSNDLYFLVKLFSQEIDLIGLILEEKSCNKLSDFIVSIDSIIGINEYNKPAADLLLQCVLSDSKKFISLMETLKANLTSNYSNKNDQEKAKCVEKAMVGYLLDLSKKFSEYQLIDPLDLENRESKSIIDEIICKIEMQERDLNQRKSVLEQSKKIFTTSEYYLGVLPEGVRGRVGCFLSSPAPSYGSPKAASKLTVTNPWYHHNMFAAKAINEIIKSASDGQRDGQIATKRNHH